MHLAECLHRHVLPAAKARAAKLAGLEDEAARAELECLENLGPDFINDNWLSAEKHPELPNLNRPAPPEEMPALLRLSPYELARELQELNPGYRLVRACRKEGLPVSPVPGPSAPAAALSAAGIAPLPHTFLGFLPRDAGGCEALFASFARTPGSLIFFERKDRLKKSLALAARILGPRDLAICRELTKTHEEFILGRLEDSDCLPDDLLGEITVLLGPPEAVERMPRHEVEELLRAELARGGKPREVARRVQNAARGWSCKELYALIPASKAG